MIGTLSSHGLVPLPPTFCLKQDYSASGFDPDIPNGASFSGGCIYLNSALSQYLTLPTAFATELSSLSSVTVSLWFKPVTNDASASLWDFGSGTGSKLAFVLRYQGLTCTRTCG